MHNYLYTFTVLHLYDKLIVICIPHHRVVFIHIGVCFQLCERMFPGWIRYNILITYYTYFGELICLVDAVSIMTIV